MEEGGDAEDVCMMDTKRISTSLREYAGTLLDEDRNKIYFVTIANAVVDEDFIRLLPESQKGIIDSINQNLNQDRGLEWVIQYDLHKLSMLPELYFNALAYLNDKKKNISQFAESVTVLEERIEKVNKNIVHIEKSAKLISGATILSTYAVTFDEESKSHAKGATRWLICLILSIVGFFVLVVIVLFIQIAEWPLLKESLSDDLANSDYFTFFVISVKAALVFAYLQIPGFIKRNYFAEKHLQQAYTHRRNVLQSLQAVYNTIQEQSERDNIIKVGASIAFSESESGYITRKEGAGDDEVSSLVYSSIFKNK